MLPYCYRWIILRDLLISSIIRLYAVQDLGRWSLGLVHRVFSTDDLNNKSELLTTPEFHNKEEPHERKINVHVTSLPRDLGLPPFHHDPTYTHTPAHHYPYRLVFDSRQ